MSPLENLSIVSACQAHWEELEEFLQILTPADTTNLT